LAERAVLAGASLVRCVDHEMRFDDVRVDDQGTTCTIEWKGERQTLRTPLAGRHQTANLGFSLLMLDAAGPPLATSLAAAAPWLASVRIAGRFQHRGQFIFDVAHNPAGIDVLVQTIAAVAPPQPIAVVLCVLRDKDWRGMIRRLSPVASRFVLTNAPTAPASRAWDLDDALAFARSAGLAADAVPSLARALDHAKAIASTVVVTGSFHTVGDAMALLPRLQGSSRSG
jgi:dihydrofolate synthase/folylpolyglutamate synthase